MLNNTGMRHFSTIRLSKLNQVIMLNASPAIKDVHALFPVRLLNASLSGQSDNIYIKHVGVLFGLVLF
jgi:hypothetical protein